MKKDGITIFVKTLFALHIELIFIFIANALFSLLLLAIRFRLNNYNPRVFLIPFYGFLAISVLYIIFSNTRYNSLSAKILRYTYITNKNKTIKLSISNTIVYCGYGLAWWLRYKQIFRWITVVLLFLVGIEFICCFIPKINNRFSLWLFSVKMVSTKNPAANNNFCGSRREGKNR